MGRKALIAVLIAIAALIGLASQVKFPPDLDDRTSAPSAQLHVAGIAQQNNASAGQVRISGTIENHGDETVRNVTATITLLNGSSEVTSRTVNLGILQPESAVSFSFVFDIEPARVDSRRITFGRRVATRSPGGIP